MIGGVTEALAAPDAAVWHQEADLSDPGAPSRLIELAAATSRFLDILICNHARSGGDGPLGNLAAGMLDAHWAVNTRASILLAQAFAAQHDDNRPGRHRLRPAGRARSRPPPLPPGSLGHPRRPGPPDRLADHRRGRLDHRPGHQHRRRLPPLGLTGRNPIGSGPSREPEPLDPF